MSQGINSIVQLLAMAGHWVLYCSLVRDSKISLLPDTAAHAASPAV